MNGTFSIQKQWHIGHVSAPTLLPFLSSSHNEPGPKRTPSLNIVQCRNLCGFQPSFSEVGCSVYRKRCALWDSRRLHAFSASYSVRSVLIDSSRRYPRLQISVPHLLAGSLHWEEKRTMRATLFSSVRANITRYGIQWQTLRFYHRESKVGGHTVRSVPVRDDPAIRQAPAAHVRSVVENEDLHQAMMSLNIFELTEIQVRSLPGSQAVHTCFQLSHERSPENRSRYRSWPIP
jgi:hypothetical protein